MAIINKDNTPSHTTRYSTSEYTSSQYQLTSFRMTAGDIPNQLVLRGTSDEDLPSTLLAQFQKRVEVKGEQHTPVEEINKRAVRFLPLLLETLALGTYNQLVLGTLEWRSENTLAELQIRQVDIIPVATQT